MPSGPMDFEDVTFADGIFGCVHHSLGHHQLRVGMRRVSCSPTLPTTADPEPSRCHCSLVETLTSNNVPAGNILQLREVHRELAWTSSSVSNSPAERGPRGHPAPGFFACTQVTDHNHEVNAMRRFAKRFVSADPRGVIVLLDHVPGNAGVVLLETTVIAAHHSRRHRQGLRRPPVGSSLRKAQRTGAVAASSEPNRPAGKGTPTSGRGDVLGAERRQVALPRIVPDDGIGASTSHRPR